MAPTRIKICGITREADAEAVAEAGADAMGLVFYPPSPRAVTAGQAAAIVERVRPFLTVVGLFVDANSAEIESILSSVPLDVLQFQGDESPEFCRQFERPWLKALHMREGVELAAQGERYAGARGLLLDTWREGVPGGTGETFDWNLVQGEVSLPLILAGGLNPANVGDAVRRVSPAAVDVSGGVETAPGVKDASKIREFVRAVHEADAR